MTLKIAMIGCGGIAGSHRAAMAAQDGAAFTAFCDVDLARAQAAAEERGGNAYDNVETMLDTEACDGVVICTPPTVRTELIEAAAKRGLPILCEKPPAFEMDTARATEAVIARHDALVSIGFLFRYAPAVIKLQALIAGRDVAIVRSRYIGDVANNPGITNDRPWFLLKEKSGGMIVDQGIHDLDLMRYLFGNVGQVTALGAFRTRPRSETHTAEDTAALQFTTDTGVLCSHTHCWGGNRWSNEMEVIGADFDITIDLNAQSLTGQIDGEPVEFGCNDDLFQPEQAAWLKAIQTGDRSLIRCTHADAVASLALALAVNKSMESHRLEPVEVL